MSKFPLDVLKRCVYPFFYNNDNDVIIGAEFGEGVALTKIGESVLVSHVDPIVGAVKDIGWLAVHVACNDIATSGTRPRWILTLVLVPNKEDEQLLKEIMKDIRRAADEIGVSVIGGHSGYSANLSRPLVSVTALGVLSNNQPPILTRGAHIGDHVFITKGIALEGTAILATDFKKTAQELGLSEQEIAQAKNILKEVSILTEALIFAECGVTAMHDVTRGGLLETLLEMAELSSLRIKVDALKIPISPIVTTFAQTFQFDPLKMISSGTLVATIPPDQIGKVQRRLTESGILFADIGNVVPGQGVAIYRGEQVTEYREIHCEEDELARMWEIYLPDDQKKAF